MGIDYEAIRFWDAYSVAEDIRLDIEENPEKESFEKYFMPSRAEIKAILKAPLRWTLLHQFIKDRYLERRIWGFEHHRKDMLDLVAVEYQTILEGYGINHGFPKINIDASDFNNYEENEMQELVNQLRELIPIEQIAHETFQLLFSNRKFLKKFNQLVAGYIRYLKKSEYPDILKRDGVLYRKTLPGWAKRGIFYRDKGRCIQCSRDLTGVIVTGEEVHYDHIVPLAVGGTNDPGNFQLLCRRCNLSKGVNTFTSEIYPTYWSLHLEK
ncbi:HNH endonuclease [Cylindrospermum sp. NIES-4074]|nr:HNH endonuclease [Cylindrospermum sp. NIES-4074]